MSVAALRLFCLPVCGDGLLSNTKGNCGLIQLSVRGKALPDKNRSTSLRHVYSRQPGGPPCTCPRNRPTRRRRHGHCARYFKRASTVWRRPARCLAMMWRRLRVDVRLSLRRPVCRIDENASQTLSIQGQHPPKSRAGKLVCSSTSPFGSSRQPQLYIKWPNRPVRSLRPAA